MSGERTAKGQFAPGHSGFKGHKRDTTKRDQAQAALEKAVTMKDIRAIVKKAVAQAMDGDASARRFIFEYLIGKPIASIAFEGTVTTPGIDQWWNEALERMEAE